MSWIKHNLKKFLVFCMLGVEDAYGDVAGEMKLLPCTHNGMHAWTT